VKWWFLALVACGGCESLLHFSRVEFVPDAAVDAPADVPVPMCPAEYAAFVHGTSQYRFAPTSTDFYTAAADCADDETAGPIMGHTHLPVLDSSDEAAFLYNSQHSWLGVTDLQMNGTWRWVTHDPSAMDASPTGSGFWAPGEPSTTVAEHCAHFDTFQTNDVNNVPCVLPEKHSYFCECDAYANDPATYGM